MLDYSYYYISTSLESQGILLKFFRNHRFAQIKGGVIMKNPQNLAETIEALSKEKGISVSSMLQDLEMNKNALFTMKKSGYLPRVESLCKFADYFQCSLDYLLGRTEEPNGNQKQLTQNEQELLDIFKNFSERDQIKILGKMEEWISTSRRENIDNQRIVGTQVARRTDHKFVKKPVTAEELEKIKALPEDTDY